jgi:hypothetical protein
VETGFCGQGTTMIGKETFSHLETKNLDIKKCCFIHKELEKG